jgi:protein-disulfide isomerase
MSLNVARKLSAALLLVLVAAPAQSQGLTTRQADDILKELRGIRQALERLSPPPGARQPVAPTAPAPFPSVRMLTVGGRVLGRADAPLTMVEFTDLQCAYCARFHATTFQRIKAEYIDTGLVRYVTRDFPLDMLHQNADLAARASRCAGEQDHFWDVRTTLVTNADKLTPEFVTATAQRSNLDMQTFHACLDSVQTREGVQRDLAEGRAVGVEGTPTFIVGKTESEGLDGVRMVGNMPFEIFDAKFKELLAQRALKR